jgi:hypothetical protein
MAAAIERIAASEEDMTDSLLIYRLRQELVDQKGWDRRRFGHVLDQFRNVKSLLERETCQAPRGGLSSAGQVQNGRAPRERPRPGIGGERSHAAQA